MQNGGAAAVIKERRRRIAVPGSISAANIIILKHLIGKEGIIYIKKCVKKHVHYNVSKMGGGLHFHD